MGKAVGIVKERNILEWSLGDKDPRKITLKDIMSKPLIMIDSNARVEDAMTLMAKNNLRRLVV